MNLRWLFGDAFLAAAVGAASGLASAGLLEALRIVTNWQTDVPWLLFLLPIAGALIAWAYQGFGKSAAGGSNLLLDQIHAADQVNRVPLRMFPLVLVSTVLTHLFGGSAGREGTAVQMGGAIASGVARVLRLNSVHVRILLMCGISGGFSSVFGTPLAGTVFGMEMLAVGGMRYEALIPCLIAAVAGDLTVKVFAIPHVDYALSTTAPDLTLSSVAMVGIAAVGFGLASLLFSELTVLVEFTSQRLVPHAIWRTFLGGIVVVGVTLVLGTRIYNGLSLPLLLDAFTGAHIPTFAFLFKLLLTAITLGVGFKGGEVTPLFVIGATLGVTLSGPLGLSPDFLAALGFIAVFAAAANTPIACVIMGAELFSTSGIIYFGIAVFVAYTISGHRGIYHSQKIIAPKHVHIPSSFIGSTLHDLRAGRPALHLRLHQIPRQRFTRIQPDSTEGSDQ